MQNSNFHSLYNFIIMNHDYITKNLLKALKQRRLEELANQPAILIEDIEKQFNDRIKWVLTSDICSRTGFPTDEVLSFVETLNFEELLK